MIIHTKRLQSNPEVKPQTPYHQDLLPGGESGVPSYYQQGEEGGGEGSICTKVVGWCQSVSTRWYIKLWMSWYWDMVPEWMPEGSFLSLRLPLSMSEWEDFYILELEPGDGDLDLCLRGEQCSFHPLIPDILSVSEEDFWEMWTTSWGADRNTLWRWLFRIFSPSHSRISSAKTT